MAHLLETGEDHEGFLTDFPRRFSAISEQLSEDEPSPASDSDPPVPRAPRRRRLAAALVLGLLLSAGRARWRPVRTCSLWFWAEDALVRGPAYRGGSWTPM